jgi:hypothetical protein
MHITVATGGQESLSLEPELAMVKGSILYGDRVTLVSPTLVEQEGLKQWDGDESVLDELRARIGATEWRRFLLLRRRLLAGSGFDEEAAREYDRLERLVDEATPLNRAFVADFGITALLRDEIRQAVQRGVLEVADFQAEGPSMELDREIVRRLRDTFANEPFPLLDYRGWLIATQGHSDAEPQPLRASATSNRLEAAVAARLLGRLEAFPFARMDEILDVRERLERVRVRFQAAILAATEEMTEVSRFEDLEGAADLIYRREVAPALLELDEASKMSALAPRYVAQALRSQLP